MFNLRLMLVQLIQIPAETKRLDQFEPSGARQLELFFGWISEYRTIEASVQRFFNENEILNLINRGSNPSDGDRI